MLYHPLLSSSPAPTRYLCVAIVEGANRMMMFKIGLKFPGYEDQLRKEDDLDWSEGWPDRRGRELRDEYGLYDSMSPSSAMCYEAGITVAIFFTKPPSWGRRFKISTCCS